MVIFHYLQQSPAAFTLVMGVLGLLVGSFLNVVIHRLPRMMQEEWRRECRTLLEIDADDAAAPACNLIRPGSRCVHCGHRITPLENIPVLSYLVLRGRCSGCRAPISLRYPAVELASGCLSAFLAWHYGYGPQAGCAILFTWALLALSCIDLEHQLLPDDITLPFLWLGLGISLFGVFTGLRASVIGAIAGYGSLWLVFVIFKLVTRKEGMGHGDFKLLAMLGTWLGWQMLPLVIILASGCGALIGLGLILLRRHDRRQPIPFGPFLAAAGWIALLWGRELTALYGGWQLHP